MTSIKLIEKLPYKELRFIKKLQTDGSGLWSSRHATIKTTKLRLIADTMDNGKTYYGELRVYFDPKTWNTKTDGLIYTDYRFLIDLKTALVRRNLSAGRVDYSEAGMQGADYVSLDVDDAFIRSYSRKRV